MAKYTLLGALHDSAKVPAQVVTNLTTIPIMQDRYYAASPYNLVRIILGKTEPGDDDHANVYYEPLPA